MDAMEINNLEFLLFFIYTWICFISGYQIIPEIIICLIITNSTYITFDTFHLGGLINIPNAVQGQTTYTYMDAYAENFAEYTTRDYFVI